MPRLVERDLAAADVREGLVPVPEGPVERPHLEDERVRAQAADVAAALAARRRQVGLERRLHVIRGFQ